MTDERNYVDGEWVDSTGGERFEVRNPAAPDEVVATYPQSTAEDAERAVTAAVEAQEEWASTPGPTRGEILTETATRLAARADEIAERLTREEGKTLAESRPEVDRAVDIFHYYGQKARDFGGVVKQSSSADATLRTRKEPMGVAGLVTPWNYPVAIPAWKLAPALATGNTAVLKPASLAPGPAHALVDALVEAGVPDGVVNLVTGPGNTVGDVVTTHEDVDVVSFTGSAAVGTGVHERAAGEGKRVQTEMGGKNPTVVSATADLDRAVDVVASGAFGVTGQACTACSRAIVHTDLYEEFVDAVVDRGESIEVGPGLDGADMGPQVSRDELDGTLDYVKVGRTEGARLVTGGEALDREGHFVEPTVFADVDPETRIGQEEIFGPVLAVIEVESYDEALAVANDVQYGLSASVVTQDLTEADRFEREIEAGIAKVNEKTTGVELHVPFGGLKRSSSNTYREQGDAGIDFFTTTKTIYRNR